MPDHRPGSIERILDAAANRAREGLRVVEDYVRFVLADEDLSSRARDMRHRVTKLASACAPHLAALSERDTPGDLGAGSESFRTPDRAGALDVVTSAFKRSQEALRSLSEFARVSCVAAAGGFESLRYEAYELEKATLVVARPHAALRKATVALVATLRPDDADAVGRVSELVRAGCHLLVLDGGRLTDRAFVEAASTLRTACDDAGALMLVASRPDVARLARADGVRLDASSMPVAAAMRVGGETAVVAYAADTVEEANDAVNAGAHAVFLDDAADTLAWQSHSPVPCFAAGLVSSKEALAALEGVQRAAFDAQTLDVTGVRAALAQLARATG